MSEGFNAAAAPLPTPLQRTFWHEARDQALHFLLAFALVKAVRFLGADLTLPARLLIALAPGLSREITEWLLAPPGKGRPWSFGSLRDLTFWLLGGLAG